MIANRTEAADIMATVSPMFPPSFDANPALFAWALFARVLILLLASATIVRLWSRTTQEQVPCDHPVFYHRCMINCFLLAACFGSLSDVIVWVSWGEVEPSTMSVILLISRALDGATVWPFCAALFVPFWVKYLRTCGMLRGAGSYALGGEMRDLRVTWGQVGTPLGLAVWTALGSIGVTTWKWLQWYMTHAGN